MTNVLTTTFRLAKDAGACQESYRKFAKHKGSVRKWGEDKPFSLLEVLEVCGIDDTLWTLRCCTESDKARRLSQIFACDCAEHVVHIYEKYYPTDTRPRHCIEVIRKYIAGEVTPLSDTTLMFSKLTVTFLTSSSIFC